MSRQNLGKINETSASEQALKEAQSKYKKKLDSGYHLDIEDIEKSKFFEPMLAKKWEDEKEDINYPVYSQPKLDGMRCIISKNGMFTRNGKSVVSAPHIFKRLEKFFKKYPNVILDGELYNHAFKDDFNKIISLAKKTKPSQEDLVESEKYLEYWVYDCYIKEASFSKRLSFLYKSLLALEDGIKIVDTVIANNESELDEIFSQYLQAGFEGQMIRLDYLYENKRSKYLLKRKNFLDDEFKILDIQDGNGNLQGIAARIILETKEGVEFEAGVIGSHKYAENLFKEKNKYIGQKGTIVYQNLTPDGKPRFGKMKEIRDYE